MQSMQNIHKAPHPKREAAEDEGFQKSEEDEGMKVPGAMEGVVAAVAVDVAGAEEIGTIPIKKL